MYRTHPSRKKYCIAVFIVVRDEYGGAFVYGVLIQRLAEISCVVHKHHSLALSEWITIKTSRIHFMTKKIVKWVSKDLWFGCVVGLVSFYRHAIFELIWTGGIFLYMLISKLYLDFLSIYFSNTSSKTNDWGSKV